MGRGVGRYVAVTTAGAVLGIGWWFFFWFPTTTCVNEELPCGMGWFLVLPLLPVVSLALPWFVLHRLRVEKPGAATATGMVVVALLGSILWSGNRDTPVPLPDWLTMTLLGALSFLIAAMLTS